MTHVVQDTPARPASDGGSYLEVDDRLLPVRLSPVEGTDKDFRAPHALGSVGLDTAFTDLTRDLVAATPRRTS